MVITFNTKGLLPTPKLQATDQGSVLAQVRQSKIYRRSSIDGRNGVDAPAASRPLSYAEAPAEEKFVRRDGVRRAPTAGSGDAKMLSKEFPITEVSDTDLTSECGTDRSRPPYSPCLSRKTVDAPAASRPLSYAEAPAEEKFVRRDGVRRAPTAGSGDAKMLSKEFPITEVSDTDLTSECGTDRSRPPYSPCLSRKTVDDLFLSCCHQHVPSNCHSLCSYEHREHVAAETLIAAVQQDGCDLKYLSNILNCANQNRDNRKCCEYLGMSNQDLGVGDRSPNIKGLFQVEAPAASRQLRYAEAPAEEKFVRRDGERRAPTDGSGDAKMLSKEFPITEVSDTDLTSECGTDRSRPPYSPCLSRKTVDDLFLSCCHQHVPSNCHSLCSYEHREHVAAETLIAAVQQDGCDLKYLSNILYCANQNRDNRKCCEYLGMSNQDLGVGDRCLRMCNVAPSGDRIGSVEKSDLVCLSNWNVMMYCARSGLRPLPFWHLNPGHFSQRLLV